MKVCLALSGEEIAKAGPLKFYLGRVGSRSSLVQAQGAQTRGPAPRNARYGGASPGPIQHEVSRAGLDGLQPTIRAD